MNTTMNPALESMLKGLSPEQLAQIQGQLQAQSEVPPVDLCKVREEHLALLADLKAQDSTELIPQAQDEYAQAMGLANTLRYDSQDEVLVDLRDGVIGHAHALAQLDLIVKDREQKARKTASQPASPQVFAFEGSRWVCLTVGTMRVMGSVNHWAKLGQLMGFKADNPVAKFIQQYGEYLPGDGTKGGKIAAKSLPRDFVGDGKPFRAAKEAPSKS